MPGDVEIEEIESTKSEKLLAVVLAVFVLIGAGWAYVKADDYVRELVAAPSAQPTPDEKAAIDRLQRARERSSRAEGERRRALERLEVRREAYRTALDAGRPAEDLRRRYEAAEARYDAAVAERRAALEAVGASQPAAARASDRQQERAREAQRRQELVSFSARLLLVLALLGGGYAWLNALRRRRSRSLPLAAAVVAAAALLALVLAGDYVTDYVDPLDLGPLVLALAGIAATLAAFAALQRYLARRIPLRRVRKRECPFCGFPAGRGPHCESCGREIVAPCATCAAPRRVGTPRCAACGAA